MTTTLPGRHHKDAPEPTAPTVPARGCLIPDPPNRRDRRKQARARAQTKSNGALRPAVRQKLERQAERGGMRGLIAKVRIDADNNRQRVAAQRAAISAEDGFVRALAKPDARGFKGRGCGRQPLTPRMREYRSTSVQVAGLWPWAVGARAPLVGTPLGNHLQTGEPVGCDPLSWFKAKMISAPIAFVLALNGFGKSSLVRRMVIGAMWQGQIPLILGDCKPDYRALIAACGGQIIDLGYGYGVLNPLEVGALGEIIPLLPEMGKDDDPDPRTRIAQEVEARQLSAVSGLVEITRGSPVEDYEETVITVGLQQLYRPSSKGGRGFTAANPPILSDLKQVIDADAPADLKGQQELYDAVTVTTKEQYDVATQRLRQSLGALIKGKFGRVFNGKTTTPLNFTDYTGVCVDVSHIPQGDIKLKAAVLSMTWAAGFGAVEAANTLADYQLAPQREFLAVLDELWQVLGTGENMVDRVNELTRLNRSIAVGLLLISHSIEDLSSLSSEAAIKKARGFIQKARIKIIGPVPEAEVDALSGTTELTPVERAWVTAWASTAGDDGSNVVRGEDVSGGKVVKKNQTIPFGMGKFLIKDSEDATPGIPIQHNFTATDHRSGVHNTNQRFDAAVS